MCYHFSASFQKKNKQTNCNLQETCHSPQRPIVGNMNLRISNTSIKSDTRIEYYLGLILDSNLNWKAYMCYEEIFKVEIFKVETLT